MGDIRAFFELVCEYPWVTIGLVFGCCFILQSIGEAIHGPKNTIIINDKEKEDK